MAKRIGVGVVGLEHWYTAFGVLEEASKSPKTKLVAIADKSRKRLAEMKEKHQPGYATSDFARVIEDPEVDLVCSLVNTRDNVQVATAALQAGKHVACVKPMAMNLRQADALIALAEREQRILWSFDQLGRAGVDPELKALLARGDIGKPLTLYHVAEGGLPKAWPNSTDPGWWADDELVPWGAWADHAIYTIDQLRCLFDSEVEMVQGTMANRRYPRLKVEDWGLGVLHFANGMVAVVEDAWTAENYWCSWTKIVGTKGSVHVDPALSQAPVVATPKGLQPIKRKKARRAGGLMAGLLEIFQAGVARPSPARESRTNLAIALGVYQSARTGKAVRIADMK